MNQQEKVGIHETIMTDELLAFRGLSDEEDEEGVELGDGMALDDEEDDDEADTDDGFSE